MKNEYLNFTEVMIPEAGKLLAMRHLNNRKSIPILPERFEDPTIAEKAIKTIFERKSSKGYAAFRNGKMTGYLIGETSVQAWGRSGYVYLPGYGVEINESPGILQDLYARLGEDWVRTGHFNHYLYVSSADQNILNGLFDLGFGKERVDALMAFDALQLPEIEEPTGITIRKAGKGDNAHLGNLSDVIFRALAEAPYWHPTVPEDWAELYEGWSELADEKDWTVWLALEKDKALGTIGFTNQDESDIDMLVPARTAYLSVAATKPEARGRGISTALTWTGLDESSKAGYSVCYTNWISPNLLASRFWPRFGFQDAAYRVAKKINPMIAWAKRTN